MKKYLLSCLFLGFTSIVFAQSNLPDWVQSAVWYQIFPERFSNGDTLNDPDRMSIEQQPEGWKKSNWTADWYKRDEWEVTFHPEFHYSATKRRYGGDLQGIINRLDYVKELGVTVLYLNPIFDAQSMHKYDGSTLHHIDRFFGPDPKGDGEIMEREDPLEMGSWRLTEGDKLFFKLIEEAHKREIKVVIDGVFNHVGRKFWAFQDVEKNQGKSPYKNWFDIKSFDDPKTPANEFDYKGWWNFKALPEFKKEKGTLSAEVRTYIFLITNRWMDPNGDGDPSDGIDGWRLDVASDIGIPFWKEWHDVVKRINPDAVTIAEIWDDKAKPYTMYAGFSGVMNYRWLRLVDDFFVTGTKTADQFIEAQKVLLADLKSDANYAGMNILESHDTERFASRFMNRDRKFKEKTKYHEGFDIRRPTAEHWKDFKLATFFQFTYVGAPTIYYGAEAGMWGADDPDNRKPMIWRDLAYESEKSHPSNLFRTPDSVYFDTDIHSWYKQLIQLRKNHPEFQSGSIFFVSPSANEKSLAFLRTVDQSRIVLVVINTDATKSATVELPRTLKPLTKVSLLGNATINRRRNHIILPAKSFDIVYLIRKL